MSCSDCKNSIPCDDNISIFYPKDCTSENCNTDSKCVFYNSTSLSCSGINKGDNLQLAIQKIDTLLCTSAPNWGDWNVHCLTGVSSLGTFVPAISLLACTTSNDFLTFVNTTFPAYEISVNTEFNSITNPNITCSSYGVSSGDTLNAILSSRLCTKFTALNSFLDISSATWCSHFSTPTTTSLSTIFTGISSQICSLWGMISTSVLPTFNNSENCLFDIVGQYGTAGSTIDNLEITVGSLSTLICRKPTFDINSLSWGSCITKPSSVTTDLQNAFQSILDTVNDLLQNHTFSFGSDFTVTPGSTCSPKVVTLVTSPFYNTLVKVSSVDTTAGYLQDKILAGANITITTSGAGNETMTIAAASQIYKVKASTTGSDTEGYLVDKIVGAPSLDNSLTLSASYDSGSSKVKIVPTINYSYLLTGLLTQIAATPSGFCSQVNNCVIMPSGINNVSWGLTKTTSGNVYAPTSYLEIITPGYTLLSQIVPGGGMATANTNLICNVHIPVGAAWTCGLVIIDLVSSSILYNVTGSTTSLTHTITYTAGAVYSVVATINDNS